MCGIAGVYGYKTGEPAGEGVLAGMLDIIRHRGPDDGGIHIDGALGIGNRRLSIIDLPGGRQPMANEDGSIIVVFNGEIYNYRELAERLRRRGHTLATASDTETLVHLYEELGDDVVHELRGMFALAVWDARCRRLLLARDRLGIKPLYYADQGGRLVFGSEIKAILRHPAVPVRPSLEALAHFISLKYVPAPETMFEGIAAVPPGHIVTCDGDGVRVHRYWDLSFAGNGGGRASEEEHAERLEELLRESVRIHLVSDVPFGAFLSGGIDSSTVVALMSGFLAEPVKTFAVGFEDGGDVRSELPYARLVAKRYGTDHHEVQITAADFVRLAERIVWHLDQPLGDEAALANYLVSELAAGHVKMVLTGEGGDELFAGYARYVGERFSPLFAPIPRAARELVLALAGRLRGLRRPKLALYALCQADEASRLVNWFPLFNDEMKAALLTDAVTRELKGASARDVFSAQLARTDARDMLSRMLYVDTKLWLADDLLARGDKTSMAASLEARVPLLDHKLVEFAAALPPELKLRRLTRKYLLKKVARGWLPPEILDRPKKGFPIPTALWMRGEARPFVRDLLSGDTVARRGLFRPAYVGRLLAEHEAGMADHSSLIWGLLSVELWYRAFIDSRPRLAP